MAVIQYKCTACKREIEIPENKYGLEVIQRCIITEGCRGELYRIGRKQDFLRGDFPSRVPGLTDYTARRALFNYTQYILAKDWYITHDMGVVPAVEVLIDSVADAAVTDSNVSCDLRSDSNSYTQVETTDFTVEIVNANQLVIHFEDPHSGFAQLIARSTAPTAVETNVTVPTEVTQMTATGSLLTVATLNDVIPEPNDIILEATYLSPDGVTTVVQQYNISTSPAIASPWDDFPTVLIQGKRYKVRTFDAYIPEMGDGTLPDGSSFYFSALDVQASGSPPPRSINPREVYVLLALDPYANIDKIKNLVVDVSSVTADNASLSFFLSNRELFASNAVVSSTYPLIRAVS